MPQPDPCGVYADERDDGLTFVCEVWAEDNRRHRIARMRAIARRWRWGDWICRRCGEALPMWKRADARFCSEGCRKADARERRNRLRPFATH